MAINLRFPIANAPAPCSRVRPRLCPAGAFAIGRFGGSRWRLPGRGGLYLYSMGIQWRFRHLIALGLANCQFLFKPNLLHRRILSLIRRNLASAHTQLPPEHAIASAAPAASSKSRLHSNSPCSIYHRVSSVVPDRAVHSHNANKTLRHSAADHAFLAPFHVKSPTQRFTTLEVQLIAA